MARIDRAILLLPLDRFVLVRIAVTLQQGFLRSFLFASSLSAQPIPMMRQLLDVMNQAEELPRRIDLLLPT